MVDYINYVVRVILAFRNYALSILICLEMMKYIIMMYKFVVRINKLGKYKINFIVIIIFHVHYFQFINFNFPKLKVLRIYVPSLL